MILLTPDSPIKEYKDKKMIFLAGPMTRNPDWRKIAEAEFSDMDIYVVNPIYKNKSQQDDAHLVEWKTHFLTQADVVIFWFSKNQRSGLISGLELGESLRNSTLDKDKKIVIGMSEDFKEKEYLYGLCENMGLTVQETIEKTIERAKKAIEKSHKLFFTSDTHFNSERTLKFSCRPFASVKDMNWSLVANWNKLVANNDVVWHLGDFGDLSFVPYLNGKIHLIIGNYETDAIKHNPSYLDELKQCFESVDLSRDILTSDGQKLHLTHKPSGSDAEVFNAFGHIHGRCKCKKFGYDVGVDANNYAPILEETLLFYKNAVIKHYDEELFF